MAMFSSAATDYLAKQGFTDLDEFGEGDWEGAQPPDDMSDEDYQRHWAEAARIADAEDGE